MYMLHSVTAVALNSWMRCVRDCNNLSPCHTFSEVATLPLHVTSSTRPLQVHTPLHTEAWRGLTSIVSLLIADLHKDVILRSRVRGFVVGSLCVGLQAMRGGVGGRGGIRFTELPQCSPLPRHPTKPCPFRARCTAAGRYTPSQGGYVWHASVFISTSCSSLCLVDYST